MNEGTCTSCNVYPCRCTSDDVTHRPSRLDAQHTACGEVIGPGTHIRLGDGETCERCTHVMAQVAAAVRGEPSWACREHFLDLRPDGTCGRGCSRTSEMLPQADEEKT